MTSERAGIYKHDWENIYKCLSKLMLPQVLWDEDIDIFLKEISGFLKDDSFRISYSDFKKIRNFYLSWVGNNNTICDRRKAKFQEKLIQLFKKLENKKENTNNWNKDRNVEIFNFIINRINTDDNFSLEDYILDISDYMEAFSYSEFISMAVFKQVETNINTFIEKTTSSTNIWNLKDVLSSFKIYCLSCELRTKREKIFKDINTVGDDIDFNKLKDFNEFVLEGTNDEYRVFPDELNKYIEFYYEIINWDNSNSEDINKDVIKNFERAILKLQKIPFHWKISAITNYFKKQVELIFSTWRISVNSVSRNDLYKLWFPDIYFPKWQETITLKEYVALYQKRHSEWADNQERSFWLFAEITSYLWRQFFFEHYIVVERNFKKHLDLHYDKPIDSIFQKLYSDKSIKIDDFIKKIEDNTKTQSWIVTVYDLLFHQIGYEKSKTMEDMLDNAIDIINNNRKDIIIPWFDLGKEKVVCKKSKWLCPELRDHIRKNITMLKLLNSQALQYKDEYFNEETSNKRMKELEKFFQKLWIEKEEIKDFTNLPISVKNFTKVRWLYADVFIWNTHENIFDEVKDAIENIATSKKPETLEEVEKYKGLLSQLLKVTKEIYNFLVKNKVISNKYTRRIVREAIALLEQNNINVEEIINKFKEIDLESLSNKYEKYKKIILARTWITAWKKKIQAIINNFAKSIAINNKGDNKIDFLSDDDYIELVEHFYALIANLQALSNELLIKDEGITENVEDEISKLAFSKIEKVIVKRFIQYISKVTWLTILKMKPVAAALIPIVSIAAGVLLYSKVAYSRIWRKLRVHILVDDWHKYRAWPETFNYLIENIKSIHKINDKVTRLIEFFISLKKNDTSTSSEELSKNNTLNEELSKILKGFDVKLLEWLHKHIEKDAKLSFSSFKDFSWS